MDFDEYQKKSRRTAIYPDLGDNYIYPVLGLVGEAGEVAEKIKKIIRDSEGKIDDKKKEDIKKELGDVLWYLSQLSTELGLSLGEIADLNIDKLKRRDVKGTLHGSGDDR